MHHLIAVVDIGSAASEARPCRGPRARPPGILFFNHQGNGSGGLIVAENGGQGHALSLTFEKSRQDQTVGLQHLESDDGRYFAGLGRRGGRLWSATSAGAQAELRPVPASR